MNKKESINQVYSETSGKTVINSIELWYILKLIGFNFC